MYLINILKELFSVLFHFFENGLLSDLLHDLLNVKVIELCRNLAFINLPTTVGFKLFHRLLSLLMIYDYRFLLLNRACDTFLSWLPLACRLHYDNVLYSLREVMGLGTCRIGSLTLR